MSGIIDYAECEYSVVGAICIEPRYIGNVANKVSSEDFTIAACAEVFESALEAYSCGKIFDPVIAADCLRKIMPAEEANRFIRECMDITPTAANAELHASLVRQNASRKRLQSASLEIFDDISDPKEAAAQMIDLCQTFLQGENTARLKTLQSAMETMYDGKSRTSLRLDTGFPKLDGILKGLWGGNLIIVGARPGVGKSAFAMDIARTVAWHGNPVLLYSLEMLADELAERMVAREGEFALDTLIDNRLEAQDWASLSATCSKLSKLPIFINDDPGTTTAKIRTQARSIKGLKLIIVDFLTLMNSEKRYDNRNLEVGAISRALKNIAAELQIPVIALAQLNRGTDDTDVPTLRNLRDSGELEQNANKVLLMWHVDKDAGEIGISVAKNRRGKTGTVKMHFDGEHMRYTELFEPYTPAKKRASRRIYDNDD